MNALQLSSGQATTMDSKQLLDLINSERKNFGEPEVRHNQFVERCKDEMEGEHYKSFVVANPNGTSSEVVELTVDQCMLVAMRESKGVRRTVQAKLRSMQAALQPAGRAASQNGLPEFRRARALDLATKTAERLAAQFPSLSEDSRRTLFAKVINPVAGTEILVLPRVEQKHYTAGEVGAMLGISANMVGRIANQHGLKTEENGQVRLDKSAHSVKQVESFVYNERGIEAIRQHLAADTPPRTPTASIESAGARK